MKKFFTLSFVVLLFGFGSAQSSFKILDPDNAAADVTNMTLDLWGDPTTDIEKELIVKNTTASNKTVKLKRVLVSGFNTTAPNQDTLQICWNVCLAPSWNTTQTAGNVTILADSTADFSVNGIGFHSLFSPCTLLGTRVIRYTFWDNTNMSDSASVLVNYHITAVGLSENKMNNFTFSSPHPNPASGSTVVTYDFPYQVKAQLKVYNIAGAVVKEFPTEESAGKLIIDTENMPNGIYFCRMLVNGKVIGTKKLIVSN
jgi:Secretion system C-terminal sorting domain